MRILLLRLAVVLIVGTAVVSGQGGRRAAPNFEGIWNSATTTPLERPFTRPWKGELTLARSSEPIYEYACHEGNYSLTNMLRGFRAAEGKPVGAAQR